MLEVLSLLGPEGSMMHPQDRRTSPRYAPALDQAHVGWWGGKHFRTTPAKLQDISSGRAALIVDGQTTAPAAVWVCVIGQGPTEWVQATIVGTAAGEDGTQQARLTFTEGCPYELFKAAVWGDQAAQPPAPAAYEPPAPSTGLPPGDRPPVQRRAAALSPGDQLACVVVVSASAPGPPTLYQAEQSQRALKDRWSVLPWATAFLISLAATMAIGVVAVERLGHFRQLESTLAATKK